MKVIGNCEHANMITLKGRRMGVDVFSIQYIVTPKAADICDLDPECLKHAEIIFEDMSEVDMLINMLERFKDENDMRIDMRVINHV